MRPWTAIMEGPDDLSEGELEVTSVLFGLGTVPILHVKGGDTTDITTGEKTTDIVSGPNKI